MASSPLPPGDKIEAAFSGAFSKLALLHQQGAQGAVFRATARDGSEVALKIYDANQVEERTRREVAAMRKLTRPTIVRLHSAGGVVIGSANYRYIATPFIVGDSLNDRIARGALSVDSAAQITIDITDAIDELWSHRIVHRDVKPANVIVKPDGRAVLIDLGVARHLDQKTLTVAGYTFGTPGYFAPEHLAGRPLSCRADVFSAGIVFQEMIIGQHPTRQRQELLSKGGLRTATVAPGVPMFVSRLIDEMVAKRAFDRPTPARVRDVLRDYLKMKTGD